MHWKKALSRMSLRLFVQKYSLNTCPTSRSPAPEANDDLAKMKFCSEIAKAKNARASGVGCSAMFYITDHNFVTVELQILCIMQEVEVETTP